MNSKTEFHQAPLVRVVPTTGLLDEQEDRVELRESRGEAEVQEMVVVEVEL